MGHWCGLQTDHPYHREHHRIETVSFGHRRSDKRSSGGTIDGLTSRRLASISPLAHQTANSGALQGADLQPAICILDPNNTQGNISFQRSAFSCLTFDPTDAAEAMMGQGRAWPPRSDAESRAGD